MASPPSNGWPLFLAARWRKFADVLSVSPLNKGFFCLYIPWLAGRKIQRRCNWPQLRERNWFAEFYWSLCSESSRSSNKTNLSPSRGDFKCLYPRWRCSLLNPHEVQHLHTEYWAAKYMISALQSMMFINAFVCLLFASLSYAQANETQCAVNIAGFTHNGDCHLLCRQASWTDVAAFFVGNYVTHAATVIGRPGESMLSTIISILMAIVFPGSGLVKGMRAILTLAVFAPTELRKAAKAGALCAVIKERIDESSSVGHAGAAQEKHTPTDAALEAQGENINLIATRKHGLCRLPKGYRLMVLPGQAMFERDPTDEKLPLPKKIWHLVTSPFQRQNSPRPSLANNYNFIKIVIAIGQLIYTSTTLYQTRGNQIETYGFGAFGLTVAPYAWMSFLNLLGNISCPSYPTMYLVESSASDALKKQLDLEAEQHVESPRSKTLLNEPHKNEAHSNEINHGGEPDNPAFRLDGAVGRIDAETEVWMWERYDNIFNKGAKNAKLNAVRLRNGRFKTALLNLLWIVVAAVPIMIMSGLSHFTWPKNDPAPLNKWILVWVLYGTAFGPAVTAVAENLIEPRPVFGKRQRLIQSATHQPLISGAFWFAVIFATVITLAACIGGFVAVVQMMGQYGVCIELS